MKKLFLISFTCVVAVAIFPSASLGHEDATGDTQYTLGLNSFAFTSSYEVLDNADAQPGTGSTDANRDGMDISGGSHTNVTNEIAGGAFRSFPHTWANEWSPITAVVGWQKAIMFQPESDAPDANNSFTEEASGSYLSSALVNDESSVPMNQDPPETFDASASSLNSRTDTPSGEGSYEFPYDNALSPAGGAPDAAGGAFDYQGEGFNVADSGDSAAVNLSGSDGGGSTTYPSGAGQLGDIGRSSGEFRIKAGPVPSRGNIFGKSLVDPVAVPESGSVPMLLLSLLGLAGGFFARARFAGLFRSS